MMNTERCIMEILKNDIHLPMWVSLGPLDGPFSVRNNEIEKWDARTIGRDRPTQQELESVWEQLQAQDAIVATHQQDAYNRMIEAYRKYVAHDESLVKLPADAIIKTAEALTQLFDAGRIEEWSLATQILQSCERKIEITGGSLDKCEWKNPE
jgi:hypothetical protein